MVEISLHILDIAQNSIKANASLVEISVIEDVENNRLIVKIKDDGCGMTPEFLKDVTNPFRTTRTTRKVGLGLSMFKSAAELTGGSLEITSQPGVGTEVTAEFVYDSIDRQPLGDMASTVSTIISGHPCIDYIYRHSFNGNEFDLNTKELRSVLGEEVSLADIDVVRWIENYVNEEIENIHGGAQV